MKKAVIIPLLVLAVFFVFGINKANGQDLPTPTNVEATTISACTIDLSWTPISSPSYSFQVRRSTSSNFVPAFYFETNQSPYRNESLQPLTLYYYQVRATSTPYNSEWSSVASTTTFQIPTPPVPSINSAVGGDGGQQIELNWVALGTSLYGGLEIERASSSNGLSYSAYSQITVLNNPQVNFYINNNLNPDWFYKYKMRSFESDFGCGNLKVFSIYSNVITVPPRPLNLTETWAYQPGGSGTITLNWSYTYNLRISFFEVWRYVDIGEFELHATTSNSQTSFAENLLPNQTYYYKVRACTAQNFCSAFSNEVSRYAASAPVDFKASISYSSLTSGQTTFNFSWENTFPGEDYQLEWQPTGGGISSTTVASRPASENRIFYSLTLASGEVYTFKVRAIFGLVYSEYSNSVVLNAIIVPLNGTWAWGSVTSSVGIGWLSLNADDENTGATAPNKYSVNIDDTGLMSGYAWSGITCSEQQRQNETCGYGWLSFNQADLTDCPLGDCRAWVDFSTDKIYGWLRFLPYRSQDEPNRYLDSSWDGWVKLRGTAQNGGEYGVCFGDTVPRIVEIYEIVSGENCANNGNIDNAQLRYLQGSAWGGNIAGWLRFSDWLVEEIQHELIITIPDDQLAIKEKAGFSAIVTSTPPSPDNQTIVNWTINPVNAGLFDPTQTRNSASTTIFTAGNSTTSAVVTAHNPPPIGWDLLATSSISILPPYQLLCEPDPVSPTKITVRWISYFTNQDYLNYASHTITLFGATSSPPQTSLVQQPGGVGQFPYHHENLITGETYNYLLRTTYLDNFSFDSEIVYCTPSSPVAPATGNLNVFANSSSTIYINWIDNATTSQYHFELRRMKVTPSQPEISVSVGGVTSSTISIIVENNVTSTPYSTTLDWSENSLFVPYVSSTVYSWNNPSLRPNPVSTSTVVGNLSPVTTYYFRAKNCSLADDFPFSQGVSMNPLPPDFCSDYATTSTTTLLAYKDFKINKQLTTNNLQQWKILSAFYSLFNHSAFSPHKSVFSLYKSALSQYKSAFSLYKSALSQYKSVLRKLIKPVFSQDYSVYFDNIADNITEPIYINSGLEADTVYAYQVRTVTNANVVLIDWDWSEPVAGKTLVAGTNLNPNLVALICLRNSYCGQVPFYEGGGEESEQQCLVNANCRDIGRSDQIYRER